MSTIKPRIVRRVRPLHDYILREGAWVVLLPTSTGCPPLYVAQYVATFPDAIEVVETYHRVRGVVPDPEAPDVGHEVSSLGIGAMRLLS